jgi:hypothetical protein
VLLSDAFSGHLRTSANGAQRRYWADDQGSRYANRLESDNSVSRPAPRNLAAFVQGLKEAGFVDGQNVLIEARWAEGNYARLPAIVEELIGRHVALIVTTGGLDPARAAQSATTTIPTSRRAGSCVGGLRLIARPSSGRFMRRAALRARRSKHSCGSLRRRFRTSGFDERSEVTRHSTAFNVLPYLARDSLRAYSTRLRHGAPSQRRSRW